MMQAETKHPADAEWCGVDCIAVEMDLRIAAPYWSRVAFSAVVHPERSLP
jgi:hypothetical protein